MRDTALLKPFLHVKDKRSVKSCSAIYPNSQRPQSSQPSINHGAVREGLDAVFNTFNPPNNKEVPASADAADTAKPSDELTSQIKAQGNQGAQSTAEPDAMKDKAIRDTAERSERHGGATNPTT
ncbi:hypothetical protein BZG36_01002 [Bifiguratus adelaidae]|uniref:Uncharacterized protein n=1 Tax=Bifiguratus adelaidae TaxID=1938954 RepID=A0A261Y6D4_9FUNG|nr:hypothetical protein BZG36_01002 [Bifiguratus adelaidae]